MKYFPYKDDSTNFFHNLLFSDDLTLFEKNHSGKIEGAWKVLFSNQKDISVLKEIASAEKEETRIRILAFNSLNHRPEANKSNDVLPEKR